MDVVVVAVVLLVVVTKVIMEEREVNTDDLTCLQKSEEFVSEYYGIETRYGN